MTTIRHHITEDLLMGYATGSLPQAFDFVVASHVSLSDDARARLETLEAVGGAVLCDMDGADIADDSLAKTLAKIGAMGPVMAHESACGVLPAPLQRVVGGDIDKVHWKSIGRGAKQCVLHSDDDASARLIYIPAGQAMPKHSHRGTEMTLVLQGAFRDEDGHYARGDMEIADEQVDHSPVAEPGEACICLVATDAPLKFDGIIPRIAQRFMNI